MLLVNGGWLLFDINQLPSGTYTVSSVVFEDMNNYEISENNALPTFKVNSVQAVLDDIVLTCTNGTVPEVSINLSGASGNLAVEVGNKNYTSVLNDGKAVVELTELATSNYTRTVYYFGDVNYESVQRIIGFSVEESTLIPQKKECYFK